STSASTRGRRNVVRRRQCPDLARGLTSSRLEVAQCCIRLANATKEMFVTVAREAGEDQAALWNGAAGVTWVEAQEPLDRLFKPFEDLLVESVVAKGARHVLDVVGGTGATTLAIARSLAGGGSCTGVDISEPMLA